MSTPHVLCAGLLMLSPRCRLPLALLLLLLSAAVAAQVLGLTNYSHWDKAAEMRACMLRHGDVAGEQTGCQHGRPVQGICA